MAAFDEILAVYHVVGSRSPFLAARYFVCIRARAEPLPDRYQLRRGQPPPRRGQLQRRRRRPVRPTTQHVFDTVLFNDLQMVAFGNLGVQGGRWSSTASSTTPRTRSTRRSSPSSTAKTPARTAPARSPTASPTRSSSASAAAPSGIAESKIFYVKLGGGNKEIWMMDYDGANQHPSPTSAPSPSRRASRRTTPASPSARSARRLPDQDVLAAARPLVNFPRFRRHQPLARLVAQRPAARLLRLAHRRPRDLDLRPQGNIARASPASKARTSRPPGTPRPARRSPGSAAAPACPSSTSWTPTAPTCSA
jgi:hypothetical protein